MKLCGCAGTEAYMPLSMQRSSACLAKFGNNSEIIRPLWPCGANSHGEAINSRFRYLPSCLPLSRARAGLWSNVSTCDGPPRMQAKITRLALGRKCGGLGSNGLPLAACVLLNPANAM